MAVTETKNPASLKFRFENGSTEDGKTKYKTKTIGNIDPEALNTDLMEVANSLLGLVDDTISSVSRVDNTTLENE